jgi:hypothetical protein
MLDRQVGLGLEVGYIQSDCHNFTVALGEEIVELGGIACSGIYTLAAPRGKEGFST